MAGLHDDRQQRALPVDDLLRLCRDQRVEQAGRVVM
jgi:hypothetical protein